MTTERRTDARGKAIARVTFTDARSDKPAEGQLRDIGRGGMFVATTAPVPLGKRLDFEVTLATGGTIAGMARVVWVRDAAAGDLPAGMGIKFIDVDNDALVAIDRLVGLKKNVRERTVLGIAAPAPGAAPAPKPAPKSEPKTVPAPPLAPEVKAEAKPEAPRPAVKSRERTVLGIAPPAATREKELSWPDEPPAAPPDQPKAEPAAAAPAPLQEPESAAGGTAQEPEPVKEPEPPKEPEPVAVKEVEKPVAAAKSVSIEVPVEAVEAAPAAK